MVLGLATRWLRNRHDAEDLVQAVMVKAIRFEDHFVPGTNLRAWICTMARNSFINEYRRRQRRLEVPLDEGDNSDQQSVPPAPAGGPADYSHELVEALERIPEEFRRILLLRVERDMSYAEIAEAEGVAIGTVMSRLHRAKLLLRKLLAEYAADRGHGARWARMRARLEKLWKTTEWSEDEEVSAPEEPARWIPAPAPAEPERRRSVGRIVAILPPVIPDGQFAASAVIGSRLTEVACQATRDGRNLVLMIDIPEAQRALPAPEAAPERPARSAGPLPPIGVSRVPFGREEQLLVNKMVEALGATRTAERLGFTGPGPVYNMQRPLEDEKSPKTITPERLEILMKFRTRDDAQGEREAV